MPQYIAFLRGINLGKRRVKMEQLRAIFESMKFSDVSTFIASGNVIFETKLKDAAEVERLIERKLAESLGFDVIAFVRTRDEVIRVAAARPFAEADMTNPEYTVNVGLFKEALPPDLATRFESVRTDVDAFRVVGREFYWLCRIRMSETTVWALPEFRALELPTSTMRNLKTFRNLAELYPAKAKREPAARKRKA